MNAFTWRSTAVQWADAVGPVLRREMAGAAPVSKTDPHKGRFRDSITYRRASSSGGVEIRIQSKVPYAPFVVEDTSEHDVTAKLAKALHWRDEAGHDHFARRVHIPAHRGNRFPERVWDEQADMVAARLADAMGQQAAQGFRRSANQIQRFF